MLTDITIGQYFPAGSVIHRLDPRMKIIFTVLLIAAIFTSAGVAASALVIVATILFIAISRVPVRLFLRSFKVILPIVIFTGILNALTADGPALWHWWFITITAHGLTRAGYMVIRIVLLIMISALLTYTTSPTELTDGIEKLLSPLKIFHLESAVHTLAMMMTIALRFIPTLIEETDKIMSAQKARGADLESGGLMQRARAMLPILIPLLISSFRRAAELADAMECRCYTGGHGRTRMNRLRLAPRDGAASIVVLAIFAAVILLAIFGTGALW